MTTTKKPLLTIAIIGCNRFHYLKALVESLRESIPLVDAQWIIVDNASIEEGLQDYIAGLDFVEHKIIRTQRNPSREWTLAYNQILELASGKYFMLLTDDVQFIVKGDSWLHCCIEAIEANPQIGSLVIDAQRRETIKRFFGRFRRWKRVIPILNTFKRYQTSGGQFDILSYGWQKRGVSPAASNCITRTEIWKQLGYITPQNSQTVQDAGGGFEIQMFKKYAKSGLKLERCLLQTPVIASIVTDMRGTQARIRGNRRYGHYFSPPEGDFYYKIWDETELEQFTTLKPAVGFEDIVKPLGFELPMDAKGNLLKNPLQAGAEFEWLHPSVEGIDL